MTTFVHISDLHFGRVHPPLTEGLLESLAEIAPHLVVISGDLTQRARSGEYTAARAFIDSLQWPCLVIPGNHDIPIYNLAERFIDPWRKWHRYLGSPLQPIMNEDAYIVLGINTTRRSSSLIDWSRGRISEAQSKIAAGLLIKQPADKLRVLVIHHPFWLPDQYLHRHIISGRDRAMKILRQAGVDLILSGHVHSAYAHILEGLIISHSGTTLSTRLMTDSPNSFKTVRGDRRRLAIATWEWQDGAFEPVDNQSFIKAQGVWTETAGKTP